METLGKRVLLALLAVGMLLLVGYATYPLTVGGDLWPPLEIPPVGSAGYWDHEAGPPYKGIPEVEPALAPAPYAVPPAPSRGEELGAGYAPGPGESGATGESTGYLVGGQVKREISYSGWMSLEVEDVSSAAREVVSRAAALGGYVAYSSVSEDSGSVTVKVPAGSFDDLMSQVRTIGEVKEERINANDVTDQIVDLQARLDNARAEEDRLLELYDMATDVSDLLEIERALSDVRERIEVLQAQLQNLQASVTYATLTVYLERKAEPAENLPSLDWWGLVAAALRALYGAIYLIVVLFFALLPIAILVGIAYLIYKRVGPKKTRSDAEVGGT